MNSVLIVKQEREEQRRESDMWGRKNWSDYSSIFALMAWAILMKASSTLVEFFADVSKKSKLYESANS